MMPSFSSTSANLRFVQRVQHHDAFALLRIGQRGYGKHLLGAVGQFMQLLLDADVRHHFAADLAEAREPVGDGEKSIVIHGCDVTGRIPAVLQNVGRFLRLAQISAHHVRTFHQEHAGCSRRHRLAGIDVDHLDGDAGQRMSDLAALGQRPGGSPARDSRVPFTVTTGEHSVQP